MGLDELELEPHIDAHVKARAVGRSWDGVMENPCESSMRRVKEGVCARYGQCDS